MTYKPKITETASWSESDLSELQKRALAAGVIERGKPIPSDWTLAYKISQKEWGEQQRREHPLTPTQQSEYNKERERLEREASLFRERQQQEAALRQTAKRDADERTYRLFPEQWGDLFMQEKIQEWRRRYPYSRKQLFQNLAEDADYTIWYRINSIIDSPPMDLANPNLLPRDLDNYYDYLVPRAAVIIEWMDAPHAVEFGPMEILKLKSMDNRSLQLRKNFTKDWINKNLPSASTFSYTALFVGGAVALLGILLRS